MHEPNKSMKIYSWATSIIIISYDVIYNSMQFLYYKCNLTTIALKYIAFKTTERIRLYGCHY